VRTAFVQALVELARRDERIWLVVGDLGFHALDPFVEEFPDRFINAGVAEQNMTGLAAGMAMSGKIVFTYSIGNFPILRCLEQIRNDVCYHHANVNVVSVGGGLAYGALGATHHCIEDLAIMRVMPHMTVVAPGDPVEAEMATRAIAEIPGPSYLRLAKTGEPRINSAEVDFEIGRAITVREGSDLTLISTGEMLHNTVKSAERLAEEGIHARVLSMHTLKPLDVGAVLRAARETGVIVTIEEHSVIGGLGGAVAEVLAELSDSPFTLKRIAMREPFCSEVGSQKYLREANSLSIEGIIDSINLLMKQVGSSRKVSI